METGPIHVVNQPSEKSSCCINWRKSEKREKERKVQVFRLMISAYRGEIIYDVKGSVCVLF